MIPALIMGIIFQNEGWQQPPLKANGCNLLAIMAIPQFYHARYLDQKVFESTLTRFVSDEIVEQDYSVTRSIAPYTILAIVSNNIMMPGYRGAEVGVIDKRGARYWPAVKHPMYNYAIRWGHLANGTEHKTLCDWQLREIYNPHPGDEIVVTERYILYWYGTQESLMELYDKQP